MKPTNIRQKCGCLTMGPRYVSMCPTHQAEFDEIHKRWAIERAAGNFSGQFIHTSEKKDEPRNPA